MKKDIYITVVLLLVMSFLLFNQIYNKNNPKEFEGKISKIINNDFNIILIITSENERSLNFYIDDKTIIYDEQDNQTNFNHLQVDKSVKVEYKPDIFNKPKALTVKII